MIAFQASVTGRASLPRWASARISLSVARGVIASGSTRSSITAGRPDATARSNAGANSSVRSTTSPWPPKASA